MPDSTAKSGTDADEQIPPLSEGRHRGAQKTCRDLGIDEATLNLGKGSSGPDRGATREPPQLPMEGAQSGPSHRSGHAMRVSEASQAGHSATALWAPFLAAVVLVWSTWIAVRYANQRIVDADHFRQTETALTAFWMLREGWQLAYQTPGWGYPWAAPIEFPIYQALVALIVRVTHSPLEPIGRLVSFSFLIAMAAPAFMIRRRLKLPTEATWVFCALLWSSPLYLYWGRTFMIDTTALFLSLMAVPFLLDLRGPASGWRASVLAALWGTLAILQKSITAGPVLLVLAAVILGPSLPTWRRQIPLRLIARVTIGVGLPLAVGVLWTMYSDVVKSHNFVGRELTLDFRLSDQYVGVLGQRLDAAALKELFWTRMLRDNGAGFLGAALLVGALLSRQREFRVTVLTCLIMAALPVLLFFDVSLFLSYYQVSSVVFLIAAVALGCVVWVPTVIRWRAAAPLIASALVVTNGLRFWSQHGEEIREELSATNTRGLAIGDVVSRYTPEGTGILVFGLHAGLSSFCPEVPYFAQRKGFTVPDWKEHLVEDDPAAYLGDLELGAMVFCSTKEATRYNRLIEHYSTNSSNHLFAVQDCFVWLPRATRIVLANGDSVDPVRFLTEPARTR